MDPRTIKEKLKSDLKGEIPDLINKDNYISLTRLPSKKNLVYNLEFSEKPKSVPKNIVVKIFQTEFFDREFDTLTKLKKQSFTVPKVLIAKKPYLIMERIEGENLCDFINDNLMRKNALSDLKPEIRENIVRSVQKLAEWFATLHKNNIADTRSVSKTLVLNKGDAHLRDFIIDFTRDELYGCDFEESYVGDPIDDLAWICCSFLDTNPGIFETRDPKPKIELLNVFLKEYFNILPLTFSFSYFADKLIEDLNLVIVRRDLDIGPVRRDTILKNSIDR